MKINNFLQEVGRRIRSQRRRRGMTQAELARKVGVVQTTIAGIERGADTTLGRLAMIADALEVAPGVLL